MYLKLGEKVTLRDLAVGMMMSSGNDAANAAAISIAGDDPRFARLMNERAEEIGMKNTHFVTPSGLDDDDHYSTAYDLALLMEAGLRNEDFCQLTAQKSAMVSFTKPSDKRVTYNNHNRLLSLYEYCIGGKTGYTRAAGRCLVSCCERDGTRFVCVTLCDPNDWSDHQQLYEAAFSAWENRRAVSTEERYEIPVAGANTTAAAAPESELWLYLPREEELSFVREMPRFVYAPLRKGDCAGRIVVLRAGEAVGEIRLVFIEDVSGSMGE